MPVLREKQFCKIPGCHVPSCPTWLSSHVQYLCSFLSAFLAVTHLPTSGQRSRYSKRLTYRLCYRGQRGSILAYGTQQQGGTQVYFSLTPSLPLWLIQLSLRNFCQRSYVCQVPIFFGGGGHTAVWQFAEQNVPNRDLKVLFYQVLWSPVGWGGTCTERKKTQIDQPFSACTLSCCKW